MIKGVSTEESSAQLKSHTGKARWQSLASVNPTAANLGKLAVDEAAAHPGGLQHLDDYYVPILAGGAKRPPAIKGNSAVDEKVPVRAIKSEVYPLIGGFTEVSDDGQTPNDEFSRQLRRAGLSDEVRDLAFCTQQDFKIYLIDSVQGVASATGGHGRNEAPFARGVSEVVGVDEGFKTSPLNPGDATLRICFTEPAFTRIAHRYRHAMGHVRGCLPRPAGAGRPAGLLPPPAKRLPAILLVSGSCACQSFVIDVSSRRGQSTGHEGKVFLFYSKY